MLKETLEEAHTRVHNNVWGQLGNDPGTYELTKMIDRLIDELVRANRDYYELLNKVRGNDAS
jgi:hypothetical protein